MVAPVPMFFRSSSLMTSLSPSMSETPSSIWSKEKRFSNTSSKVWEKGACPYVMQHRRGQSLVPVLSLKPEGLAHEVSHVIGT